MAAAAAALADRLQEMVMKMLLAALVVVVVAVAFLVFTTRGHRVLNFLGFATADCNGSQC
jgi:hypothetical protein